MGITTGADIKKSVIKIINGNFDFKVRSNEVVDNFDKPSFFVYIPFSHSSPETVTTNRRTYQVEIQLNNAIHNKLLEVQEELYSLFDYTLSVKDRVFSINNVDSEIIDKNLYFNFEISFMEIKRGRKVKEHKTIEEININYKEGEYNG